MMNPLTSFLNDCNKTAAACAAMGDDEASKLAFNKAASVSFKVMTDVHGTVSSMTLHTSFHNYCKARNEPCDGLRLCDITEHGLIEQDGYVHGLSIVKKVNIDPKLPVVPPVRSPLSPFVLASTLTPASRDGDRETHPK